MDLLLDNDLSAMKEMLISNYYKLGSRSSEAIYTLINCMHQLNSIKRDTDLILIISVLRAAMADEDNESFEECCSLAAPIFEILDDTANWGYLELFVVSVAINYLRSFDGTSALFQKALKALDTNETANDPKYMSIHTNLHFNYTQRLLRAKLYNKYVNKSELKKLFKTSYNHAYEVSQRKNLPMQYVLQVRRGLFENNRAMIEEGLYALKIAEA